MLKLLIFVMLFVIEIMLHATTIQDNSSRVNNLPVRSEVVHNILQLQLRNDSRYDDYQKILCRSFLSLGDVHYFIIFGGVRGMDL